MPDGQQLTLFAMAALVVVIIPGPNHLYIATRAIAEGRRAGVASSLGVETGTLVHVAAAAIGLSYVIAQSAVAFAVIRYAGAAYLIFLGVRTLLRRDAESAEVQPVRPGGVRRAYLEGVLVNVLNPKVALFFLAFLPHFVDRSAGSVPLQTFVLGLVMATIGMTSNLLYAFFGGSIGDRLRASPRLRRYQRYGTGTVYLGLGVTAALVNPAQRG